MKFENLSPDIHNDLELLQEQHNWLWEAQRLGWRYFPLIVTGKSWTGKDTVWQAAQKILEEDFWIVIPYSQSRYLTREMRPWEENSPLNFITQKEFKNRNFVSSYEFSGNLYGLDMEWVTSELQSSNIAIMNWYPPEITRLFDVFFSLINAWVLPALVITFTLNFSSYSDLLEKRWWRKEDIMRRREANWMLAYTNYWYKKLSIYRHYNVDIYRSPSHETERNQEHFNVNVINVVFEVLWHISKYLDMSPEEIKQERTQRWLDHKNSRP